MGLDDVRLRLVKTHDREVLCDQDGRQLDGVLGFRYEQTDVDAAPVLIVKLILAPCEWDGGLGVVKAGEPVDLKPSSID